jgi:sporulation protein YlmC with PRC-barrel domain
MQILRSDFIGKPVMGVHTGEQICVISDCVVHKDNLKIVLFAAQAGLQKEVLYLLPNSIRFADSKRLIVDSAQSLSEFDELVRYQHDILHTYKLLHKKVITSSGKRLGTVIDYSFDNQHNFVQKLYVRAILLKRFLQPQFIIDRSAILDTKPNSIVVKDAVVTETSTLETILPSKPDVEVTAKSVKKIPN